eukprot:752855-Hanusia_phi.AAC.7
MVPVVDVKEWVKHPLNSYILDFYKHGQRSALERWNGVYKDDVWERLREFDLTLKALSAAVELRQREYEGTMGGKYMDEEVLGLVVGLKNSFSERLWRIAT